MTNTTTATSAAAAAKAKGHFLTTAYAASADQDLSSSVPPPLSPDLLELDAALWALARMQDEDERSIGAAHDQLEDGRELGHGHSSVVAHGHGHGLNLNLVATAASQLAAVAAAAPANQLDGSLGTPVGSPRKRPSLSDAAGVGARDRLRRLEGIAACIVRCGAAGASEREILRVLLAEGDEDAEEDGSEAGPGDTTDDDDTTTDDDDDLEEEEDEDDEMDEEEMAMGYRHFSRPRHGYRTTSSERVSHTRGGGIGLGLLDLDFDAESCAACDLGDHDDHPASATVLPSLYNYVITGKTHSARSALAADCRER